MEHRNVSQSGGNGKGFSRGQLVLAFVVAAIADIVLIPVAEAGVLALFLDAITAGLLFIILGWRWILLPALVTECIPGLNIFPFWILVVGSLGVFGAIKRPGENELKQFLAPKNEVNSLEPDDYPKEKTSENKEKFQNPPNFVDATVIDEDDK